MRPAMKLFDTHSHLHDEKFSADRDECIARAREAGVSIILTLGDTIAASERAIALAEQSSVVIAAAGIHPSAAATWCDETAGELEALLDHPHVAVLGEIGMDFYWDKTPETLARQEAAFREQLRIARRRGLPVSIHTRDCTTRVLEVLEQEHGAEIGGVLHCFAGSLEEARRGIDMGFLIGVGGSATYPKANDLREVLHAIGPGHLVLETDAPYLAPQSRRGKRNEPAFVAETARLVAEAMGIDAEALAATAFANGLRAFRLENRMDNTGVVHPRIDNPPS